MASANSNVRDLNESRAQALQALQSVSERLGNILDTDFPEDGTRRNESGELVNEEGLPIIDITEPLDELDTPSLSAATEDDEVIEEDNYPEPISKLSPAALDSSRKHRDKILDLLEQEEEREESKSRQEHQLEMKRKREVVRIEMQKRMLTQGLDLEKRRQAKELEKKMAKALISGLGQPESVKSKTPVAHSDGKTKKVVTFADPPSAGSEALPRAKRQDEIKWGDVVPASLPAWKNRVPSTQTQPMKMEVVERTPAHSSNYGSTRQPLEPKDHREPTKDSDDESELEVASDSTVVESEDEDVVLSARLHRELALEYHRRREALALSPGTLKFGDDSVPDDHGHDAANWDREEVPLDATLVHPLPKPTISKFKASLFERKDNQIPTTVTPTTRLPSSPRATPNLATFDTSVPRTDALAKSVKLGKLVDGQLVAGPEDEEDVDRAEREEEEIRKLLLKSMDEYSGIAAQVMGPAAKGSYWANSVGNETASSSRTPPPAWTSKSKPKASRFKVNRTQSHAPSGTEVPASAHDHETSTSGPTSSRVEATSVTLPTSSMPVSDSSPHLRTSHQNHIPTATPITPFTSVITSPSFTPLWENPPPSNASNGYPTPISPSSRTMVIDSPSFMPPSSPNVIESSSLPRPVGSFSSSSARGLPTVIPTPSNQPPKRHASIMVDNVKERSAYRDSPASNNSSDGKLRRVSRFKADRSYD